MALTYGQAVGFDFVNWDDPLHLTENPLVLNPGEQPLSAHLLTERLGYPIPFTVLSYRLEHALVGLAPPLYHLTNICLHWANGVLVFLLIVRLQRPTAEHRVLSAFLGTCLFAVHPVTAEAVCWISARKDLLSLCLGLLTLHVFSSSIERGAPWGWRSWLASALFALSVLAKPWAVGVIPVLVALLLWKRPVESVGGSLFRLLPSGLVACIAVAVSYLGQVEVGATGDAFDLSRILLAAFVHLRLLVVPIELGPKYILDPASGLADVRVLLGTLCFILPLAGAVCWRRRCPLAAFGSLVVLVFYLPNSNLVPLTRFAADVYLYAPLVGCAVMVADLVSRRPRAAIVGAVGVAVVVLAILAHLQAGIWKTGSTLWTRAYDMNPDSPQVCRQLGNAYNREGRPDAALAVYTRCADQMGMIYFRKNIALTLFAMGRLQEAHDQFAIYAEERPDDPLGAHYLTIIRPLLE